MDINQIIAQASQPHVDAINNALEALRKAREAAVKAGFEVAMSTSVSIDNHANDMVNAYFPAFLTVIAEKAADVKLTYSVSIVSPAERPAEPAAADA